MACRMTEIVLDARDRDDGAKLERLLADPEGNDFCLLHPVEALAEG